MFSYTEDLVQYLFISNDGKIREELLVVELIRSANSLKSSFTNE